MVHYLKAKDCFTSDSSEQYFYQVFSGPHEIEVAAGDSCFYLNDDKNEARLSRGPQKLSSQHFACVVRGYAPPNKTSEISFFTNLPYINGCSTRQIFPPERPGDPNFQMLKMPRRVKEQSHHLHSTARAVYVLKGSGLCVSGTSENLSVQELKEGSVCVLAPMCPHHFETKDEELFVLPLQIWSSIGNLDFNHPMYNGTLEIS